MIEKYSLNPTYAKDNGLWLLNVDSPELPVDFAIKERNIVYIPAGQFGGNHKHPRSEAFVGIGEDLELVWLDQDGGYHSEIMNKDVEIYLFVVQPLTPHVVINKGTKPCVLIEFGDDAQHDVEPVDLLSPQRTDVQESESK